MNTLKYTGAVAMGAILAGAVVHADTIDLNALYTQVQSLEGQVQSHETRITALEQAQTAPTTTQTTNVAPAASPQPTQALQGSSTPIQTTIPSTSTADPQAGQAGQAGQQSGLADWPTYTNPTSVQVTQ